MSRIALALLAAISLAATQEALVVPLEVPDGGYLYVRARLAGQTDARLMLDTGAGINTLSPALVRALGSNLRPAGRHTGTRHNGETVSGPIWTVSSMSLGGFAKENVVVGEFASNGADGLLSMDFFRDQPFTIDIPERRLTFETAQTLRDIASAAVSVPIRLKENGPNELDFFVRICIGQDVEAESEFDTGAGFNMLMLQPPYMARLQITPAAGPRGPLEYYVHSTTLPEMHYCAAPGLRTSQQFVGFKSGLIYQGLVGHGAFRDRRLTIDIPGRRMLAWQRTGSK